MASSACAAAFSLSDACGKPMWHPHPDISARIDACRNSTLNISERVVQQHFVVTDINARRRHTGKSTVKGRSQRISRVGDPYVGVHEFRDLRVALMEAASPVTRDASTSARLPPAESPVREESATRIRAPEGRT